MDATTMRGLPGAVSAQLTAGGGWLESYWPGIGLLAAAALLTTAAVLRRVWRTHQPRHRLYRSSRSHRSSRIARAAGTALLSGLILVLIASGGAVLVNAYAGYLPDTASLAGFAGLAAAAPADVSTSGLPAGAVREVDLGDTALDVPPSPVWIYTPAGYQHSHRRHYPVVYLFHGDPGTGADWFRAGRIAHTMDVLIGNRLIPAAIVVAPDLNGGGIQDTEGLDAVRGPRIATWFTRDVVGWTDSHLRTLPDRAHRIVGGMSSGGYAALDIALHHLGEFGAVIAQEPYGDPGQDALARLGGSTVAFREHSPSAYLSGMRFAQPLAVFFDVGGDGDPHGANLLATELRADHQQVLYRVETGQHHTWAEARAGIPYALVYTFRALRVHNI